MNRIRDALAADADNNHTDRPGDTDDEWEQTWLPREESSMGADAVSWTVSAGFHH